MKQSWKIDETGHILIFDSIVISFQRYELRPNGLVDCVPSSLGALPVARDAHDFLLPLAENEAFWVGVTQQKQLDLLWIAVESDGRTVSIPTMEVVVGRPIDGRMNASFARVRTPAASPVDAILLDGRSSGHRASAKVLAVSYDRFEANAGYRPASLDPRSGYRGWRLP